MNQLKLRNNILLALLVFLLTIIPFAKTIADQYYPAGGGGGGSGTVTSLSAGTGITLSPSPITTTGTITNNGVLSGDGIILNTSPTSNALTAANAAAYTFLGNNTANSATPTYTYGLTGVGSIGVNTTLTAGSPSIIYITAAGVNATLPVASTCIGKEFDIYNGVASNNTSAVLTQGADGIFYDASSVTSWTISPTTNFRVVAAASGHWQLLGFPMYGIGSNGAAPTAGAIFYSTNSTLGSLGLTAVGLTGQPLVSTGTTAPQFTSSLSNLTSIGTTSITAPVTVQVITADSDGATITFNLATSNWHSVTLGGNRMLALSNPTTGQQFTIALTQDGSGSRTVTWFSGIKWAFGDTPPTLTTTAGQTDIFTFKCYGTGAYYGFISGQNM